MTAAVTPRCSIVIPLYNKARTVAATIASVRAQTFSDFEVVVVDDGSTDGSADLVRSVDDPRIRVIAKPNGGASSARNLGIARASADVVFFFDADDWMHPEYLRLQMQVVDANPAVNFFAARFLRFDANGAPPQPWPVPATPPTLHIDDLPTAWRRGQSFITSSVAMRRVALLALQPCFAPGESNGEDMDLWFRAAETGPLVLVDIPLVGYAEGQSDNLSADAKRDVVAPYVLRMAARSRTPGFPRPLAKATRRYVGEVFVTQARGLLVKGHRLAAIRALARGRAAAAGRRWWVTWAMTMLAPSTAVNRWEYRRIRRTQERLS